jgi:DNA-binding Lrp family transcriptional regulator
MICRVFIVYSPYYFVTMTTDDTDQRLLALLREDARAPAAVLGRKLGLARTTVQSRIERLLARGEIAGFTVRTPESREQIVAQVMITAAPKLAARAEAALRAIPAVRRLYSVSGRFDMIAVLAADTVRDMDAAIDRIGALEGVERTESAIVLSTRIDR